MVWSGFNGWGPAAMSVGTMVLLASFLFLRNGIGLLITAAAVLAAALLVLFVPPELNGHVMIVLGLALLVAAVRDLGKLLTVHLRRREQLTVSELARPFDVSLPAVLKHLNVLSSAGLIVCRKRGRTVTCRLEPRPLKQAIRWMGRYERYWSGKLDRLAALVETEE